VVVGVKKQFLQVANWSGMEGLSFSHETIFPMSGKWLSTNGGKCLILPFANRESAQAAQVVAHLVTICARGRIAVLIANCDTTRCDFYRKSEYGILSHI
jgi:hypothetical protein